MIRFNDNNFAQNLPDAYKKDGNNNKLLQIVKDSTDSLRHDIQAAIDCLDLNKAAGKTLDLYGEVVAQE